MKDLVTVVFKLFVISSRVATVWRVASAAPISTLLVSSLKTIQYSGVSAPLSIAMPAYPPFMPPPTESELRVIMLSVTLISELLRIVVSPRTEIAPDGQVTVYLSGGGTHIFSSVTPPTTSLPLAERVFVTSSAEPITADDATVKVSPTVIEPSTLNDESDVSPPRAYMKFENVIGLSTVLAPVMVSSTSPSLCT